MTVLEKALHLAIQSAMAMAHLLLPLLLPRQRERSKHYPLLLVYGGLAAAWVLAAGLAPHGADWIGTQSASIADHLRLDLPVLLTALLVPLTCQQFDRRGHWAWGVIGALWSAAAFGLHLSLGAGSAGTAPATTASVGGWLVFACSVVILTICWTLRASQVYYRNRGVCWLLLVIFLLAGQAILLLQNRWGEIGSALHLLGTAGMVTCLTSKDLPNVKGLLRAAANTTVLIAATASLYLLGLLIAQILLWAKLGLYGILIGIAIVSTGLALVHQRFQRLITQTVNTLLGAKGYDPAQIMRDYGRIISNVRDLEQLATLAIGTIGRMLDVKRGALIVVAMGKKQITLRMIEGLGEIGHKELAFSPHSPILLYPPLDGNPFFQHDLDHHPVLRQTPPEEKEGLRSLGMEIYLPILGQERLLGFLALGSRRGEPYGSREVAFLTTLAQQTSAALQNAYLFNELRALNVEITQLNKDLREAYTKLEKMDQAKADFVSISSHELRTPLTVIQGYTDILEELASEGSLTREQNVEIARNLKTAIERLATIVTAMLDASTIEAKALDLTFTPTTLQSNLNMAVAPWRAAIKERGQELIMEGTETIPPIEADLQRLCQAFGNIISNAIKYTPDGGRISIAARMAEDNEHFEVVITDTGVGIDRENQELIFEKFYRVGSLLRHSTGESKFRGAGPGLGLHIARGVIEAHGGHVWVESEGYDEERCPGSQFHIVLPLKGGKKD